MSSIKKFIGEKAYKFIENSAYNADALRSAFLTPQNARAVFSDLTEYEIRSLVADISNTGTIGTVLSTTKEEIKAAFAEAGYLTVIFDDKKAIAECAKYYRDDEKICTYKALESRMKEYHMLVAIKGNIDEIKRSNNPQRDDEYGTSIINIQIARNGSHMSIKNRYNHTVDQCDSTFDNDLNHIKMGLHSMVLGYYGFAGLKKKDNRNYYHVVDIGGIYLKYHTEINNKYFGAFVLDNNGASYTDAGRYYIPSIMIGNCNELPMVFDFQNKKVIDLVGANAKSPLISRALREGIIHSGNKETVEMMQIVFQDAKKELLQANKKALQYAAETFGYDFQKPYKITGIFGGFTAKSIEKVTGSNNALLLLSDEGKLHAVRLDDGKFQAKDIRNSYGFGIDTFYSQGGFEEKRKSGNNAVYVIQQDESYFRPKKKEIGRIGIYSGGRMHYFDEMTDSELAQYKLRERLEIYKANKRKAEAQAIDYTSALVALENEFYALKAEIVSRLKRAETYEEFDLIHDMLSFNFCYLIKEIGYFRAKVIAKNFESPQKAEDEINRIKDTINKKWEQLGKKKEK